MRSYDLGEVRILGAKLWIEVIHSQLFPIWIVFLIQTHLQAVPDPGSFSGTQHLLRLGSLPQLPW